MVGSSSNHLDHQQRLEGEIRRKRSHLNSIRKSLAAAEKHIEEQARLLDEMVAEVTSAAMEPPRREREARLSAAALDTEIEALRARHVAAEEGCRLGNVAYVNWMRVLNHREVRFEKEAKESGVGFYTAMMVRMEGKHAEERAELEGKLAKAEKMLAEMGE